MAVLNGLHPDLSGELLGSQESSEGLRGGRCQMGLGRPGSIPKNKADFVKSFAELLLLMLHLESRIEVLGSIEAQFSRCMLVFSPFRKEEKNPQSV